MTQPNHLIFFLHELTIYFDEVDIFISSKKTIF
jgi:hypothetical protein